MVRQVEGSFSSKTGSILKQNIKRWFHLWCTELVPYGEIKKAIAEGLEMESFLDSLFERKKLPKRVAPLDRKTMETKIEQAAIAAEKALKATGSRVVLLSKHQQLRSDTNSPFLVVRGNFDLFIGPVLAVVGTRKLQKPDKQLSEILIRDLLEQTGATLVSGGAYGVDTIAHRMALACGNRVMIVIAGGMTYAGPQSNIRDFDKIVEAGGWIVSHRPPQRSPSRYEFLKRNRIIASMSDAVIVVRAPIISGALGTARHAKRLGKSVFAVPGDPTNQNAEGCNLLLKQGAKPYTCPKDVVEIVGTQNASQLSLAFGSKKKELKTEKHSDPLGIISAIKKGASDIDSLLVKTGVSLEKLHEAILMFELDGLIVSTPSGLQLAR